MLPVLNVLLCMRCQAVEPGKKQATMCGGICVGQSPMGLVLKAQCPRRRLARKLICWQAGAQNCDPALQPSPMHWGARGFCAAAIGVQNVPRLQPPQLCLHQGWVCRRVCAAALGIQKQPGLQPRQCHRGAGRHHPLQAHQPLHPGVHHRVLRGAQRDHRGSRRCPGRAHQLWQLCGPGVRPKVGYFCTAQPFSAMSTVPCFHLHLHIVSRPGMYC